MSSDGVPRCIRSRQRSWLPHPPLRDRHRRPPARHGAHSIGSRDLQSNEFAAEIAEIARPAALRSPARRALATRRPPGFKRRPRRLEHAVIDMPPPIKTASGRASPASASGARPCTISSSGAPKRGGIARGAVGAVAALPRCRSRAATDAAAAIRSRSSPRRARYPTAIGPAAAAAPTASPREFRAWSVGRHARTRSSSRPGASGIIAASGSATISIAIVLSG